MTSMVILLLVLAAGPGDATSGAPAPAATGSGAGGKPPAMDRSRSRGKADGSRAAPPAGADRQAAIEERVEVRASPDPTADVAAFATTLGTEDLAGRGEDLAGLLRQVPGARIREYGGLGRFATVSLRSATSEQVMVTVDGIPQNRSLGGAVDLSFIPATQIERVTVYRGFAPASAGLAGLGGLVDVRTRAPSDGDTGRIDLLAGELGTVRASAGGTVAAGGGGHLRVGVEQLTSDGDFRFLDTRATPFDPSDDVVRRRRNNRVENLSVLVQGSWDGLGGGRMSVNGRFQDDDRGVPGVDSLPSLTAHSERGLGDIGVAWTWRGTGRVSSLDLAAGYFDDEQQFTDLDGDIGVGVQDQTTDIEGAHLFSVIRLPTAHHHWLTRVAARSETARVRDAVLSNPDLGGADRNLASITIEDVMPLGRVTVAPSLKWETRHDTFRAGGSGAPVPAAPDVRRDDLSGKIGVAIETGGACVIRGSVGRFVRNPNLLELFGDRGTVRGNPALRPEQGVTAEAGVSCSGERGPRAWSTEIVAFGRRVDDLIRLLPTSQATSVARNIESARITGVETAVTWHGFLGFDAEVSGTWQRAVDDSGGFADGRRLVFSPNWLGHLAVGWSNARFTTRWEIAYVGENSTDSLDTPFLRLPARVIHDLDLRWRLAPRLRVGVNLRNVFDRRTRDVARFPLPGRTAFLFLGYRFGKATS
ncbi:MAG: TonB-dependent receptor domain-containing protein [Acidobacteriota bacterium]